MDVLTELLPSSYTGKTEPSAKDSRRHRQEKRQENDAESVEQQTSRKKNADKSALFIERRTGEDRRLKQMNRGRWLESRDRKDRRANPSTVFVKV